MTPDTSNFIARADKGLTDPRLKAALGRLSQGFQARRRMVTGLRADFEALRDEASALKDHILSKLDHYLLAFEAAVQQSGGQVHWARDAAEARQIVLDICRAQGAKTVTKGKSMVTEEIALNPWLEAHGITPVETDLGEYIIQLRGEAPSHIVAPAFHLSRQDVADTFREAHGDLPAARALTEPKALVDEARTMLRQAFLSADVGITGANFLIAETGSTVIVTNEGNGDLTEILPKTHIVVAGVEKVVPTLDDAMLLLRLLARSATGQEMSSYTTFTTGPKRAGDPDGPDAFHVVLLDNGRTRLLGTPAEKTLACIRCGACMNHCPVYGAIGGHAYGWVYPGPIGAALTPGLLGIESTHHLPMASTFCGRCEEVCPVKIPLTQIMRHWREEAHQRQVVAPLPRLGLAVFTYAARFPAFYRLGADLFARALRLWTGPRRAKSLPIPNGWTAARDFPAPQGRSFQSLWREGKR